MGRLVLLTLLTSCQPVTTDEPGNGPPNGGGDASLTLTAPADGSGTYAGAVSLAWEVEGFTLDGDAIGEEKVAGRGHVHVYVDGALVEETAEDGLPLLDLGASGAHTILVRLAENDHDELRGSDSVEVLSRRPTLRLLGPTDGQALTASSVPLVFTVDDFDLVDAIGEADVFGEGHFRVLVDGEPRDRGADPLTAVASGLVAGARTVAVELVTNDGVPLEPPVSASVSVDVPVGARGVYWDRTAFAGPFDSATVPVSLTSTSFVLYDRDLGRPPVDGEGHLHLYLDGAWLDATAEPTRVLQNMAAGLHVFEARLVTNDGFELPIVDRLWVDVASDRPDVAITYPGAAWRMAPTFDLTYTVENFTLDASAMGGANAPHAGHATVWLDGVPFAETADTTVPFTGLLPGEHVVRLELANHDRTPVEPRVYTEIPIVVE